MRDIFGSKLVVGDIIAFNQPSYKSLIRGTIVKINNKMLRISYRDSSGHATERLLETNEYPEDVAKKPDSTLKDKVKSLFDDYLDVVEESGEGRIFHPITISCCRALKTEPLGVLLQELKTLSH